MKTSKKNLRNQRQVIDKRLRPWLTLRGEKVPPSGWIKAIQGALGINTRQLAEILGTSHSTITELEQRESKGKATLEVIDRVARAMNCKLVYAIVPEEPYVDLESIVDERAKQLAVELSQKVEHSMKLEDQGSSAEESQKQVERLAYDLKSKMDSRIWNKRGHAKPRRQK